MKCRTAFCAVFNPPGNAHQFLAYGSFPPSHTLDGEQAHEQFGSGIGVDFVHRSTVKLSLNTFTLCRICPLCHRVG